jgi:hypothetical protein
MKQYIITSFLAILVLTACKKEELEVAEETTETVTETVSTESTTSNFTLTSLAIENGELLQAFKCEEKTNDTENSIPLAWSNIPSEAKSLAIVMHHFPNASDETKANSYLLLWDIDPTITEIAYGKADEGEWYMGANKDGNAISYTSPCSPSSGSHEYSITIYALSETPTSLPNVSSLTVDYDIIIEAISTVTVIDKAILTFNDVNE